MNPADDIPAEVDFSGSARGKFHRAGQALRLPIHLDGPIQARLSELASIRGVELDVLVNDLLRKNLELIEMLR